MSLDTGISPSPEEQAVLSSPNDGRPDHLGDLDTRSDIHDLVVNFYRELVMDELLSPMFEEVAEVDWAAHIPLLIDYWCRVLLGDNSYSGNIVRAHRHVHDKSSFTTEHFDRWYGLWILAVDQRWAGPTADRAKSHAAKIGGSLARRLSGDDWQPVAASVPDEE